MMNNSEKKKTSKFLSLVLRHKPESIGIELDKIGWVDIHELIQKSNQFGLLLDFESLKNLVETNDKKRFTISKDFKRMRANQGHSINVDLGYTNQEPPEFLFHGTGEKSIESIKQIGLEKRNRQHVHLSDNFETAIKVGRRHGKPFVFKIKSREMFEKGFKFYLSDNGVWLTVQVPKQYITVN